MCEVRDPQDLPPNQQLTVTLHVGDFHARVGNIRISTSPNLLSILIPSFVLLVVILIVVFVVFYKAKQKQHSAPLVQPQLLNGNKEGQPRKNDLTNLASKILQESCNSKCFAKLTRF